MRRLRRRHLRPAAAQPRARRGIARAGVAQAATAGCVLTGYSDCRAARRAAGARTASGVGLVVPAEVGLVPADGEPGAAAAGERAAGAVAQHGRRARPCGRRARSSSRAARGWRSPLDAVSFVVCAALLLRIRVPRPRGGRGAAGLPPRAARGLARVHLADVAVGDGAALRPREPRWSSAWLVLGPAIAKGRARRRRVPGRRSSPPAVSAPSSGGLLAMRMRPPRPLLACVRGRRAALRSSCSPSRSGRRRWVIAAAAFVAGARPRRSTSRSGSRSSSGRSPSARSRGSAPTTRSGSFVFMPLGLRSRRPARGRDRDRRRRCGWPCRDDARRRLTAILAIPAVWSIRAAAAGADRRSGVTTHRRTVCVRVRMAPVPDRVPPHRRRPHVPLQLAVRARPRRRVPAADREHRHEPRGRRGGRADPAVALLARDRLGRAGHVPARRDGSLSRARRAGWSTRGRRTRTRARSASGCPTRA